MSAHYNKHDEIVQQIKQWTEKKKFKYVRLEEKTNGAIGPSDDYFVRSELIFNPLSDDRAFVVVSITDDGAVGFAIETWKRLLSRHGKNSSSPRIACGHEPVVIKSEAVLAKLDILSTGDYYIKQSGFGFLNMYNFKLYVLRAQYKKLETVGGFSLKNSYAIDYIHVCDALHDGNNIFRFKAW